MDFRECAIQAYRENEDEHKKVCHQEAERLAILAQSKLAKMLGLQVPTPTIPDNPHPPYVVTFSLDGILIQARREAGYTEFHIEFYVAKTCEWCNRTVWRGPCPDLATMGKYLEADQQGCEYCDTAPAHAEPDWATRLADAIRDAINEAL